MAQKVQTLFIDDIDGGAAEGTVRFGLDGTDYEIDLSGEHNDELHKTLERYIAHARKVGGASARPAVTVAGALAASTPQRFAPGRGSRALTSRSAAAYPPMSWRNTRRRQDANRPGRPGIVSVSTAAAFASASLASCRTRRRQLSSPAEAVRAPRAW